MGGEAGVGFKRRMHGVMGKVQEERLVAFDDLSDVFLGLNGEGFGEECLGAMIFVQMRHGMVRATRAFAIILFAEITAGRPEGSAAHVDVEAEVQRLRSLTAVRSKVRLANVDGLVAFCAQHAGQGHVALFEPRPIPFFRTIAAAIVAAWIDPVGRPMPRGILPGHDRDARRRTHAHCIKLIEPNALLRQPFHPRRAIVIIQRVALGFAVLIREKRHRRVHHPHVIDQKHHDVGKLGRVQVRKAKDEKGKSCENRFHEQRKTNPQPRPFKEQDYFGQTESGQS